MSNLLPVEIEDPTAFLGMEFKAGTGFELTAIKYIINWFLAERNPGTLFRPYPEHGWRARNRVYERIGDSKIRRDIMPVLFNDVLPRFGITPELQTRMYQMEQMEMLGKRTAAPTWEQTLGKNYLLTDEQKAKFPEYYAILGRDVVSYVYQHIVPKD
jgi:hypothetical protein